MSSVALPDPERTRRYVGGALLTIAVLFGFVLLLVELLLPPLAEPDPLPTYAHMLLAAALALPAGLVYLTVPRLLDRYDPEPWYALIGCMLWGSICATSFALLPNTCIDAVGAAIAGPEAGETIAATFCAPFVEEFFKGVAILGVFYFLRREFDGVVDGIIYATFTAVSFAAVENVIYYANAMKEGADAFAMTFVLRGILGPWGHPLYSSMTGIGFGVSRETSNSFVRWTAPFIGYLGAVFLHMLWNGSASLVGFLGAPGVVLFVVEFFLWLLFVGAFLIMIVVLVRRRGNIIRQFLQDEVALGNLSSAESDLVGSAFGILRARFRWGGVGVEFARAIARLALSKWHALRAEKAQTHTVSIDFVVPLRRRIAELRAQLGR